MTHNEYPPPPHYPLINTQLMTAKELRETLEDLWEWVHEAEMAPEDMAPPDELIFEAPKNELNRLKEILTKIMPNSLNLSLPLTIDINIAKSWGELK